MEHNNLSLDVDKDLINKILEDINMRYVILFLYVIRNDLFNDLSNQNLIDSYERVLILDEIYKDNVIKFWDKEFTNIAIDLGLFKNIRSVREFEQKEGDFLLKLGEETITIEKNVVSIPDDTLYLFITKKFKSIMRRDFNLALTKLKGVSCQKANIIHPFLYEIGEHDFTISDDLYYILDQFGNIFQAIKIEHTIEGFFERYNEIEGKIYQYIEIFDPLLNSKPTVKKVQNAIEQDKEIIRYLKDEKIKLAEKFNYEKVDQNHSLFNKWYSTMNLLLMARARLHNIKRKLDNLRSYYTGKNKRNTYLSFIEKVSFNEDNIVNNIQNELIDLREEVIEINEKVSNFNKKDLRLLNLDFERLLITSSDE